MIEPISRLDAELTSAILSFLGLSRGRKPTLKLLDELVTYYGQEQNNPELQWNPYAGQESK